MASHTVTVSLTEAATAGSPLRRRFYNGRAQDFEVEMVN
jgi:hypothetical protein